MNRQNIVTHCTFYIVNINSVNKFCFTITFVLKIYILAIAINKQEAAVQYNDNYSCTQVDISAKMMIDDDDDDDDDDDASMQSRC